MLYENRSVFVRARVTLEEAITISLANSLAIALSTSLAKSLTNSLSILEQLRYQRLLSSLFN
jgi:hypothetical protein